MKQPLPEGLSGFKPSAKPETADMSAPMAAEGEAASPEEQALYERFTRRALQYLYDKEATSKIVAIAEGAADPQTGIGSAAATVAQFVINEMKKSERRAPPPEIVLAGTEEIVAAIGELTQAGTGKEIGQETLNGAMMAAADNLRLNMSRSGDYSQEMAKADVEEMKADPNALAPFMGGMA